MNEQETIADIIAAMRGGPIPQHRHDRELLRHYADRLEAAHKRESGDAAKLREAVCEILSYIESFHKYITPRRGKRLTALFAVADTILSKARAALAAPPRNCDVGTAEEQSERYNAFCYGRRSYEAGCGGCPLIGEPCCELAWAQLPYEEGGGGRRGGGEAANTRRARKARLAISTDA